MKKYISFIFVLVAVLLTSLPVSAAYYYQNTNYNTYNQNQIISYTSGCSTYSYNMSTGVTTMISTTCTFNNNSSYYNYNNYNQNYQYNTTYTQPRYSYSYPVQTAYPVQSYYYVYPAQQTSYYTPQTQYYYPITYTSPDIGLTCYSYGNCY